MSLALIKKNKKPSKLNPGNINKCLKAKDDTIEKLKAEISSKDKEPADQKKKKKKKKMNLYLSKRLKQMSVKETWLRTKV